VFDVDELVDHPTCGAFGRVLGDFQAVMRIGWNLPDNFFMVLSMTAFRMIAVALSLLVISHAQEGRATKPALMSPREFQAIPSKPADKRIHYGEDAEQFGDLRVPEGEGSHPVAILIHGGCFTARYADLRDMAPIADELKAKGVASWSIEYRRLGQAGGGWPGTYLDVGHAIDHLRKIASTHKLDLKRLIIIGHSAGGHLTMWAAARGRLRKESPLYVTDPLLVSGIVNLAGPPDMDAYFQIAKGACGPDVVESLLGGKPSEVPARYADVSAGAMTPLRVPQVLVWGERDDIHPIILGETYLEAARQGGDEVKLLRFAEAGHFEIASPFFTGWKSIEKEVLSMLEIR